MAFTVQTYPGDLAGLANSIEAALYTFDDTRELTPGLVDRQLTLHGPFPIFTSRPEDVEDDRQTDGQVPAERAGWRALVACDEQPLALVEIVFGPDGVERYSIRERDAAKAFASVLQVATERANDSAVYDVRWFTIPDIYVSALWLAAPENLFLPTRLGSAVRPEPQDTSWAAFRGQVLLLIEAARFSAGADFLERDVGSPRSGLPIRR